MARGGHGASGTSDEIPSLEGKTPFDDLWLPLLALRIYKEKFLQHWADLCHDPRFPTLRKAGIMDMLLLVSSEARPAEAVLLCVSQFVPAVDTQLIADALGEYIRTDLVFNTADGVRKATKEGQVKYAKSHLHPWRILFSWFDTFQGVLTKWEGDAADQMHRRAPKPFVVQGSRDLPAADGLRDVISGTRTLAPKVRVLPSAPAARLSRLRTY
jgi:hypothetical protein